MIECCQNMTVTAVSDFCFPKLRTLGVFFFNNHHDKFEYTSIPGEQYLHKYMNKVKDIVKTFPHGVYSILSSEKAFFSTTITIP